MDIPLLLNLMPISFYNSNGYTIITLLYHYHTYLLWNDDTIIPWFIPTF